VRALVRAGLVEPLLGERLRLHPLLRAYAYDKLVGLGQEMSEAFGEVLGEALVAYWLAYAKAHPSRNGQDPIGMDAQEAGAAGLMGALEWAHAHERHRALLDAVYALGWTWRVRVRRAEERRFRPWTIEAARELDDLGDLRFMMHELALLDANTGEIAAARLGYEEALRLTRELGDRSDIRVELHSLAVLDDHAGNNEPAEAVYRSALDLARKLGDPTAEVEDLRDLGELLARTRDPAGGRVLMQEAIAIFERLNDIGRLEYSYRYVGRLDLLEQQRD
jgi:tetratricopeptide (TPR) repeat protein